MGAGIWSMHFIGMLAMQVPFELAFQPFTTALSGLLALSASAIALHRMAQGRPSFRSVLATALVLGSAISGMHYVGMSALDVAPGFSYRPEWVVVSVLIAVGASAAAVWIAYLVEKSKHKELTRGVAAVVMGAAIASMHYSGMKAVRFAEGTICGTSGVDRLGLTVAVSLFGGLMLVAGLSIGAVHRRLHAERAKRAALQEQNRHLRDKALTDALTGLPNREYMEEHLSSAICVARTESQELTVLFIDLDGFKAVNDRHGHLAGDSLLKQVAARLTQAAGLGARVFRVSGDEFVVVARPGQSREQDELMGQRLLEAVREPCRVVSGEAGEEAFAAVTASIGLARFPDNGEDARSLILAADASMYGAKQTGKNQMQVGAQGYAVVRARPELVKDLEHALAQGQAVDSGLFLHYQPIVGTMVPRRYGAEALIRWNHADKGLVSPGGFVPQSEAHGLGPALGDWVLERVLWQLKQEATHGPRWVNVNLSVTQLQDLSLPSRVEALLRKYGVPANRLGLEVTESMAMLNFEASRKVLGELRELGVLVSMDDFGTGYSSLANLHRLPMDKVKVDRSFIERIEQDPSALRVVEAVVALSNALGLDTVVEGVETEAQFMMLADIGVQFLQGFGIAKPMDWAGLTLFGKALHAHRGEVPQAERSHSVLPLLTATSVGSLLRS